MALKDKWNNLGRNARLEMQEAEERSKRRLDDMSQMNASDKTANRHPNRYRLYDKIKVSVRTMDIIIYVVMGLLIACLIIGIALGNPQ